MEQNPFVKCVDIHNIIPEISSNIYYLFETGGPHYFSKCTCKVESIYKQNIWPFIYIIKNKKRGYAWIYWAYKINLHTDNVTI